MTLATRRALCAVMVFAIVDKAGTIVMKDGEELDSWSVILNGQVEIETESGSKFLQMGDRYVKVIINCLSVSCNPIFSQEISDFSPKYKRMLCIGNSWQIGWFHSIQVKPL